MPETLLKQVAGSDSRMDAVQLSHAGGQKGAWGAMDASASGLAMGIRCERRVFERAGLATPMSKRALDVAGSLAGLILLSPLYAVLWAAIKLDSPGPVIYVQKRAGQDGKPLNMLKFRTMFEGNSCEIHKRYVTRLIAQGPADMRGECGSYKIEDDPRVTRVGRVLRRTSLDELPQLINVLRGDMSLVGPRPPLDYEVELYSARHRRRLRVLPGITGLWQVSGRTRLDFEQMIELDLEYIDTWSLRRDLAILGKTVAVVLQCEGAW